MCWVSPERNASLGEQWQCLNWDLPGFFWKQGDLSVLEINLSIRIQRTCGVFFLLWHCHRFSGWPQAGHLISLGSCFHWYRQDEGSDFIPFVCPASFDYRSLGAMIVSY